MGKQSPPRVLIVDDTPAIHETIRGVLQPESSAQGGQDLLDDLEADLFGGQSSSGPEPAASFVLDSAFQGKDALGMVKAALKQGKPYSLAFVDMRMPPGWDGLTTIEHLWKVDPALQIVICTAYSDRSWTEIRSALGSSHRLLILKKPFEAIEVAQIAEAMTAKWAARQAERELLERTLGGTVGVTSELLSLVTPSAGQRSKWLRACVRHLATELRLRHWAYELAAGLSQVGCMMLPSELVANVRDGHTISATDQQSFERHPSVGARVIKKIPRMELVAAIIGLQLDPKPVDWSKRDESDDAWVVAAGSQLLNVALVFDTECRRRAAKQDAVETLEEQGWPTNILGALSTFRPPGQTRWRVAEVPLADVEAGMVFTEDVLASNGLLVCPAETAVTKAMLERLQNFASRIDTRREFRVRMPAALFAAIEARAEKEEAAS